MWQWYKFFFVTYNGTKHAKAYVIGKPFQCGQLFVRKVRAYPRVDNLVNILHVRLGDCIHNTSISS